jgi:hypothetical protein
MNYELEALEKRIARLERQNRRLKCLGFILFALATATATWGQRDKSNVVMEAQKFELRDDAGRLRADLLMLNGEPALRFFDKDETTGGSLLDGHSFTIFRKGGGEADIQASFGGAGLSFEGEHNKVYVSLRADEEEQSGKLQLNDYRHKAFAGVTPADLSKLHADKAR